MRKGWVVNKVRAGVDDTVASYIYVFLIAEIDSAAWIEAIKL